MQTFKEFISESNDMYVYDHKVFDIKPKASDNPEVKQFLQDCDIPLSAIKYNDRFIELVFKDNTKPITYFYKNGNKRIKIKCKIHHDPDTPNKVVSIMPGK